MLEIGEKVVPLVIDDDERREVLDIDLAHGLHAQFGEVHDLDRLDGVLRQDRCRAADRTEVETAVFAAGVGHLLRAVALGHHHQRTALRLEQVHVGVHAPGRRGAERTRSHALRRLGRTGVVNRMLLEVFGHRLALVEHLLDAGVGDVAGDDQRAAQIQARLDRVFRENRTHFVHALVEVDVHGRGHRGSLGRQEARGILLQLFEEDALGRDLGLDVAVGRAAHADGHGARSRMARSADHPHVVHEVLAAELGADAALAADFQHLLLPFQVAEAAAALVARGGQLVEVAGRSLLHRRKAHLGRRAADADGQVVGRTGRRAEVEDMLLDEFRERLLVQQRFGLLVEEGLVGRAAALGDEEELVLHAGLAAVDVDLRGKVRARVLLVGHRKGNHLRIAQVTVLVGLVNAPGDALGVVGPRPDILALVADADGRAGVLAGGQFAFGRDGLVQQHRVGHELVVVGGFGVFENVAQFLEMRGAQVERHVGISLLRKQFEALGIDLEDLASVALHDLHVLLRQKTVLGFVFPHGERLLIDEICHSIYNVCMLLPVCPSRTAVHSRPSAAPANPARPKPVPGKDLPHAAGKCGRMSRPSENPCKFTKNNPDCTTISRFVCYFFHKKGLLFRIFSKFVRFFECNKFTNISNTMVSYKDLGLVNTREMFAKAIKGGYAVPAFNFNNMEQLQAIVMAAAETKSPVILQVSKGARNYANQTLLRYMAEGAVEYAKELGWAKPQIVLHLDHGDSFELCKSCVDMGFSSVMIDGSALPYDENVALTKRVVEYAHQHDVTVEGELGVLAGVEDEVASEVSHYTKPEEVVDFVTKTGVDSLAISIGTSHGAYKFTPEQCTVDPKTGRLVPPPLAFDVLAAIEKELPGFPIVLHGSSSVPQEEVETINKYGGALKAAVGIPEEELRQAAKSAVCKINIDSDSRLAMTAAIREVFATKPAEFDPRKYLGPARDNMKKLYIHKIKEVLGSDGKAE